MSRVTIFRNRESVASIFELLGRKENDLTASLAWALAKAPHFREAFLHRVLRTLPPLEDIDIRIQRFEQEGGITDIELVGGRHFFVVVEAKRGWTLPTSSQLRRYARRVSLRESPARRKRVVVLTECSDVFARYRLQLQAVAGVPVTTLPWQEVLRMAAQKHREVSFAERHLVRQLMTYLRGAITMQDRDSNWVYVVALSKDTHAGWRISFMDVVTKRSRYFHPIGHSGWPKEPPNYLAFRYDGRLQTIHHVDSYEVVTDLHSRFPEVPDRDRGPHFVYTLGPAFRPDHEVRTGKIYPNGRVWCMLDTLFTCRTISAARDLSRSRKNGVPE